MSVLKNLAKSRIVRIGLILTAAFWGVAFFVPSVALIQILSAVLFCLSVPVAMTYWPNIVEAVKTDSLGRPVLLAVGIFLFMVNIMVGRLWSGIIRVTDAEWMRTSPFIGFYVFIAVVAAVAHIEATSPRFGEIPGQNRRRIIIAVAVGILMGTVWTVLSGDAIPDASSRFRLDLLGGGS